MEIGEQLRQDLVLKEVGRRLALKRILMHRPQDDFAKAAGLSRSGLQRLERGDAGARLSTFISALRALGCLGALDAALPSDDMTPFRILEIVKGRKAPKRIRARKSKMAVVAQWGDCTPVHRGF